MFDFIDRIRPGKTCGIIPARGGSKSVSLKNMHLLAGRPLIDNVIGAGKASNKLMGLICSTDHEGIAQRCREFGISVHDRPPALAKDESRMDEVVIELLESIGLQEGVLPEAVALLMPTSPFVLPSHIDRCVDLLLSNPSTNSVQTVTKMPHNYHAYNQRIVEDGRVRFAFPEERSQCHNKQSKPAFYVFGNIVVTRTASILLHRGDLFATPSMALEIDPVYALDVDTASDFAVAEWYISSGQVQPTVCRS
ncbi:acylneuraminate cytidylyltransferase family protein [Nitrospiraceae bacterium AH_259_D15_M11_P09]|nr:acylneuraminate cytidylyltransferase family protein [Nitrospiraceae bacterium AH_259_D15_M11_P09]